MSVNIFFLNYQKGGTKSRRRQSTKNISQLQNVCDSDVINNMTLLSLLFNSCCGGSVPSMPTATYQFTNLLVPHIGGRSHDFLDL